MYGLGFGLIFMLFNAAVEPGFERLVEHQSAVRETIRTAKNLLYSPEDSGTINGNGNGNGGGDKA